MQPPTTKHCHYCGAEIDSFLTICSHCGMKQPKHPTEEPQLPEEPTPPPTPEQRAEALGELPAFTYRSLDEAARAIRRGERRFYVEGLPLRYRPESPQAFLIKALPYLAAVALIAAIGSTAVLIVCVIATILTAAYVVYTFRRKRPDHLLYYNLVTEGHFPLWPDSPLTRYRFRLLPDGRVAAARRW